MIWMWSVMFACISNISGFKFEPQPEDTSTALDDSGDSEVEEMIPEDSMENFKIVYCEEYADRCDIYETLDACEADFDSWYAPSCRIVDKSAFDECVDWLLSLDCSTEGWIPACDNFYEC